MDSSYSSLKKLSSTLGRSKHLKVFVRLLPGFSSKLQLELRENASVLELGCGDSSVVCDSKTDSPLTIGFDVYRPFLLESKRRNLHSEYVIGDVRHLPFRPRAVQTVIALELIEHLEKREGLRLLAEMEEVASRSVIVSTPNGFIEKSDVVPWQNHRSGYSCKEMRSLGYAVVGIEGLRQVQHRVTLILSLLSLLTQPFVYFLPDYAYGILCEKRLR